MSEPQGELQSADAQADIFRAVTELMGAAQHMHGDPASVESIEALIDRLKHLLNEEKHTYTLRHQNSEKRHKIESLHNLIQFLQAQVQKAHKATQRSGLKYYLASISSTVLGDEVSRIGQSMETKLQSWLDQQGVRELAMAISTGSDEARMKAIASFEEVVQRGFDASVQDTILSAGLAETLAGLLEPGAASWDVQKEAAFSLSALLDFNKDIFLSLVLTTKVVENLLRLMDMEPDPHILILVCVLKGLLAAGQTIIADEIYTQGGVPKLVSLLDSKSEPLKHAAMDCVFEMAYYGRMEVVQKMFELEVIQKLANLQESSKMMARHGHAENQKHSKLQDRAIDLSPLPTNGRSAAPPAQNNHGGSTLHPFSNAVTRFALHLAIGTGLRKRERRALKLQFLKQVKEIVQDDAEVANITAEVLWAP